MRTYMRKKVESEFIDGVEKLCRLCLEKSHNVVPIFTDECKGVCTLALRIMMCVGLEMVNDECLPNIICFNCRTELDRYYTFRKKCEITYHKLKSHVQAIKNKKLNKSPVEPDAVTDQTICASVETIEEVPNVDTASKLLFIDNQDPHSAVLHADEDITHVECNEQKSVEDVIENTEEQLESSDQRTLVEIQNVKSLSDLSVILPTMLLEVGILTKQDGGVKMSSDVSELHLETGDGRQVVFEIVEEDDKEQITEQSELESRVSVQEAVVDDAERNNVGIQQHYTSPREVRAAARPRLHRCGACGRRFTQRQVLKRHLLTHDEVRPFRCVMCPKSYTQRAALSAHARSHAPHHARPLPLHRCAACPKVFLYPSGLSRHMMSHRGRVFVCGGCARPYRDKSSLTRHQRNANCPHTPAH